MAHPAVDSCFRLSFASGAWRHGLTLLSGRSSNRASKVMSGVAVRRVALLVVATLVASVAGCGSQPAPTLAEEDGDSRPTREVLMAELSATDGEVIGSIDSWGGGVFVEAVMSFEEDRHVVGMTLQVGGGEKGDIGFYPAGFDTENGDEIPDEFDVPAGEILQANGSVAASCAGEPDNSPPVLEVSFTRGGGEVEVERLEMRTLTSGFKQWVQVEDVVRAYCEAGVQAHLGIGRMSTDGGAAVVYRVHNPGPEDVSVTSQAGSHGIMRWSAAGPVRVPAGETVDLRVRGQASKQRCRLPGPLHLGLMQVAGRDGSHVMEPLGSDSDIC